MRLLFLWMAVASIVTMVLAAYWNHGFLFTASLIAIVASALFYTFVD